MRSKASNEMLVCPKVWQLWTVNKDLFYKYTEYLFDFQFSSFKHKLKWSKHSNMKATFRKIVIDTIPVILGVLIALVINNLKDDWDNRRYLKKFFASLNQEMIQNKGRIDRVIKRHEAVIDSLEKYESDTQATIAEILSNAGGFQAATISNTSWNAFLNSRIELIDFETMSQLSEIEHGVKLYNLKLEQLMSLASSLSESSNTKDKRVILIQIKNILNSEEGIQTYLAAYLKRENL